CDRLLTIFNETIKTYRGMVKRIETLPEPNAFNEYGFMTNPIMNIHEHTDLRLRNYRNQTLKILTHQNLQSFLRAFHGPRVRLLSCNHFDANPVTTPHQDAFFWGDKKIGEIIGAWVALENIHAKAGRLFVSPFSHTIDLPELARKRAIIMEKLYPNDASYRRL